MHKALPECRTQLTELRIGVSGGMPAGKLLPRAARTEIDRHVHSDYLYQLLGEPRQGAERPSSAPAQHGDPLNLIQFMLA